VVKEETTSLINSSRPCVLRSGKMVDTRYDHTYATALHSVRYWLAGVLVPRADAPKRGPGWSGGGMGWREEGAHRGALCEKLARPM